jgi:hypothetical protein
MQIEFVQIGAIRVWLNRGFHFSTAPANRSRHGLRRQSAAATALSGGR